MFTLTVVTLRLLDGSARALRLSRPAALGLSLFFLLGLVSSSIAFSPRHAFFEWANFLLLLGLAWAVAFEIKAKGDRLLDLVLLICALGCALYLLVEAMLYVAVLKAGEQPKPNLFIFGFGNYRFFNHVQTISLPLLALWAMRLRDPGHRAIGWAVTTLWWMLLYVSAGRGVFVALLLAIALVWCGLGRAAAPWCRQMIFAALAGFAAYLLFYVLVPLMNGLKPFGLFFNVVDRSIEDPASGRFPLWERALEMIQTSPWLGAGPNHFAHEAMDLMIAAHPHNWILQIGSEWGLPALLVLMGVLALALRRLWQLRLTLQAKDHSTLTAWLVTGLAILGDGLVSGLIVMPTSQLWIALYLGCAWGWAESRTTTTVLRPIDTQRGRPSAGQRITVTVGTLLMIYALANGLWPEISKLDVAAEHSEITVPLMPRIWANGIF